MSISCIREQVIVKASAPSDVREFIDAQILQLSKYDTEIKYNQYYIIQVRNLLYMINTNSENLFKFIAHYEVATCEDFEKESVVFFKSVHPKNDIASYYTHDENVCNITIDYNSNPQYPKVSGKIFKITKKGQEFGFRLLKKGDISKDIINDTDLQVKYIKIEEPKNKILLE